MNKDNKQQTLLYHLENLSGRQQVEETFVYRCDEQAKAVSPFRFSSRDLLSISLKYALMTCDDKQTPHT